MSDIRELDPASPPPEVGDEIKINGERFIVIRTEIINTLTDPPRIKSVLVEFRAKE